MPIASSAPTKIGALWAEVLDQVSRRPRLRSLLVRLTPIALDGSVLVVAAPAGSLALAKDHAAEMASLAGRVAGKSMRVEVVEQKGPALEQGSADTGAPASTGNTASRGVPAPGAGDPALHPLVQQAVEIFGATVVRVERRLPPADP
jgi:hypothetical protein